MLKLKQTAVAVLALGSSAVFAGTMGPVCAPGNVTIPCEKMAWDFGAQALYLRPSYSGDLGLPLNYYNGVYSSVTQTSPKWGWGFQIEGSYHFNTGNDLNVNWYHLSKNATGTGLIGSPLASIHTTTASESWTFNPKWDAVNIEMGQHIDFSDMKYMRLHAGAQFARIRTTAQSSVAGAVGTVIPSTGLNTFFTDTFNGFGPRMGADLFYDVGSGLGIYAKGAGALLVGSQKANVTGYPSAVAFYNYNASRTSVIVPELEGKLGAKYDYVIAQGDFTLDVGYLWINYFDAAVHTSVRGGVNGMSADSVNFGLNGLYFGLKWVGNI